MQCRFLLHGILCSPGLSCLLSRFLQHEHCWQLVLQHYNGMKIGSSGSSSSRYGQS